MSSDEANDEQDEIDDEEVDDELSLLEFLSTFDLTILALWLAFDKVVNLFRNSSTIWLKTIECVEFNDELVLPIELFV